MYFCQTVTRDCVVTMTGHDGACQHTVRNVQADELKILPGLRFGKAVALEMRLSVSRTASLPNG
jgi:hypothetical protein